MRSSDMILDPRRRTVVDECSPAMLERWRQNWSRICGCGKPLAMEEDVLQGACVACRMGETLSAVDHPDHYGGESDPFEAIKVIEAWGLNFNLGNVLKYIARAGRKGDRGEDLAKALWYLKREVER